MTQENNVKESFVLDERSLAYRLDALRVYGQQISMGTPLDTWAQVMFGAKAGQDTEPFEWVQVRQRCIDWYQNPERADGTLAPEQAFLLALLGILEAPTAAFNRFPARFRDLYYWDLLGLTPLAAQADQLVVQWGLVGTVKEQVITAGQLLEAGQDSEGHELRYRIDRPVVVNQARWTDLRWCVPDELCRGKQRAQVAFEAGVGVWPAEGLRLGALGRKAVGDVAEAGVDQDVIATRVIGSPLLEAASGQRVWTLIFDASVPALEAAISVDNVWTPMKVKCAPKQSIEWTLRLSDGAGEPTAVSELEGLKAETPLLRLRRVDGGAIARVKLLSLAVQGATNVHCVTDDGDEIQAGLPFGESATAGRGVNFMSPEWVRLGERLNDVTITPNWVGLPSQSFSSWYKEYLNDEHFDETTSAFIGGKDLKTDFTVNLSSMANGTHLASAPKVLPLFDASGANPPFGQRLTISLNNGPWSSTTAVPDSTIAADWPWYLRLSLTGSFYSELYQHHLSLPPGIIIKTEKVTSTSTAKLGDKPEDKPAVITQVTDMPSTTFVVPPIWNPPYLPQWQSVRVDYTASDKTVEHQLVSTPFGWADADDAYRGATADVYLGVDGIEPRQLLSLYWWLKSPGCVQRMSWEYLAYGERWVSLGNALLDETADWAKSGLWSLMWPDDALHEAKGMPAGRYWLRARVSTSSPQEGVPPLPRLMGLATNVSVATLVAPTEVAASHFAQPLAAGSVTHALNAPDAVQQVTQLWASTGGCPPESPEAFYPRVAARLRHRERALDPWDLVTLLREHDTGIREVAVLPQPRRENNSDDNARDGTLPQKLVVMPTVFASDSEITLQPIYSTAHLKAFEDWLKARTSPWLTFVCENPRYRSVRVSWSIKYRTGISLSYGDQLVRNMLECELRPWLNEGRLATSIIGKSLNRRIVRACIMQVPEVEQLTTLLIDGDDGTRDLPGGLVEGDEIAVVECVPLAYHNMTIRIWASAGADNELEDDRVIRLSAGTNILVRVERCDNAQKMSLYDVDTGMSISLQPKADAPPSKTLSISRELDGPLYQILIPPSLRGVYRIGVAWDTSTESLRSSRIGEWVTLEVQVPDDVPDVTSNSLQ